MHFLDINSRGLMLPNDVSHEIENWEEGKLHMRWPRRSPEDREPQPR